MNTAFGDMFHLPLSILEKVLRPVIVYLCLIVLLRIFGKRELAQLNPFDLVVLLSLSNTVQNAIIGDDNSVSGGVLGAFALLAINWLLARVLYKSPKMTAALEGQPTCLIYDGVVDMKALDRECMTEQELVGVLNRNGFDSPRGVARCVLEPNGTFYVQGMQPSPKDVQREKMLEGLARLEAEVAALRRELADRR